jgi:hypothetical protein
MFKKQLFVISLVTFYEKPLLQTAFCALATSFNLIIVVYQNPFKDKFSTLRNITPEVSISLCIFLTVAYALDD